MKNLEKTGILPSVSDGRAFSSQQPGCKRRVLWNVHGFHKSRHDSGCSGGRSLWSSRFSGSGKKVLESKLSVQRSAEAEQRVRCGKDHCQCYESEGRRAGGRRRSFYGRSNAGGSRLRSIPGCQKPLVRS